MTDPIKRKKYLTIEGLLIAGVFVCLLSMAGKSYIWFDEAFTMNLIRHPFGELLEMTALDVHPPLYYLITKLFYMVLGDGSLALRLSSILCYVALLVITAWFFNKYFSMKTAITVLVAFGAAPNMLKFAMQMRMYSLAMLLVTAAFYLVYIIIDKSMENAYQWNRYWVILAVVNVLAAYTHYFAGVAAVSMSFFLLGFLLWQKGSDKKRIVRNWALYCVVMLVLYLPWLPTLFGQMSAIQGNYWIAPISEASLHAYPQMLFEVPTSQLRELLIAAYISGVVLFVLHFAKDKKNCWVAGCYVVLAIWLGMGIGYSVLRNPIINERYLMVLFPLLWIPVCVGFAKSAYKYVTAALLLLFVLCFTQIYDDMYYDYSSSYQNEMVAYLNTAIGEEDAIFHTNIQDVAIGGAYFPDVEQYAFEGLENGQAFQHWEALTGYHAVAALEEVEDVTGNIWCFNGGFAVLFEEAGWQTEALELNSCTVYRFYK